MHAFNGSLSFSTVYYVILQVIHSHEEFASNVNEAWIRYFIHADFFNTKII